MSRLVGGLGTGGGGVAGRGLDRGERGGDASDGVREEEEGSVTLSTPSAAALLRVGCGGGGCEECVLAPTQQLEEEALTNQGTKRGGSR